MASLIRGWKGALIVQFRYRGKLYREFLGLQDTRDNRRDKKNFVRDLNVALRKANFDFAAWFPKSKRIKDFAPKVEPLAVAVYIGDGSTRSRYPERLGTTTSRSVGPSLSAPVLAECS